ncbi:MAG: DUF3696 domain-containing protein [Gammaproteobacteria bacterium]|nr:DUF3696 domain-containing protein [Gammaproteobacteria bacterium]
MLRRIDFLHFKCFEVLRLPLKRLTLLSGINASGKSSVMQAFALFHQTIREHEWSQALMLNGSAVRLGTAGDVIDQVSGSRNCSIRLCDEDREYEWEFAAKRTDMSLTVTSVAIDEEKSTIRNDATEVLHRMLPRRERSNITIGTITPLGDDLMMRLNDMSYLTAERTGPRDVYPLEGVEYSGVIGSKGEHAVSLLYSRGDESVFDSLALPDFPTTRLRQVEARMASFFPGFELEISPIPRANSLSLGVRTSHETDFHRPVHTGFGITQVLPIVVAALLAEPNSLILIENPEVHLHPMGQATMGEFLAEVAAAGVQVVLETHSDHVVNGVRRAVKRKLLGADDTAIHFFRSREDAHEYGVAQVQTPRIAGDGSVDHWPDGFFDQFDKDMSYFADWS